MSSEDWKRVPVFLHEAQRVRLTFRLPNECPCCLRRFQWGWMDEELSSPFEDDGTTEIRMLRIPRPDQTVFCPECEARILN